MFRVIDWNLSYHGKTKEKIELLKAVIEEVNGEYPCVVALQEVTERAYSDILEEGLFQSHCYSLQLRQPGKFEGNNRGLGCFIGSTGGIGINSFSLIDRALFPERALCANMKLEEKEFEIISFHSLTGVVFKKGKSAQFASLADYLHEKKDSPIILCCDLNEPKVDHSNTDDIECFDQLGDKGKYASYILKPDGVHNLKDAYRLWLDQNQEEYVRIKEKQNNCEDLDYAPLTVSHTLRGGKDKRYDYIMISPHFKVVSMDYRYEDALKYGSDHAVLVADVGGDYGV
jgi:endonuclease/exonuclease/phosphatase family metal-dependent hydrolase